MTSEEIQAQRLEIATRALAEGAWSFMATRKGWMVQAGGDLFQITPDNGGWACTCPDSANLRSQGLDCEHVHGLRLRQEQVIETRRAAEATRNPAVSAAALVRDYLCSDCWGCLVEFVDPQTRKSHVHCTTEGCECSGYVSKRFVERRKAESAAEKIEAREALKDAVPWLSPAKKSTQQLLAELGF